MWSPLVALLIVGLASADYAWKPNTEYKYLIKGRTLAALHQVANEYVGVVSQATLTLQAKGSDAVFARITDAQYSTVQANLPGGWASRIPEKELNYRSLPLSSKPFQIKFKNGVVDGLAVSKDLSTPEVNLIKSVVSQLQVDTRGENEIKWPHASQTPKRPSESVFSVMEDTVTGKCEVMYDISPLPLYATQVTPELVPMPELRGDGRIYDIVKTKNFTNCDKRVAYHYGFTGLTDWEPADNRMGHFFSRSSVSRIVVSGSLNKYTIQSSVTSNKVILSPAMYNAQKGMVVSRMNLTLVSMHSSSGSPPSVPNAHNVKDLVYDYNDPFSSERGSGSSSRSGFSGESGKSSGKGSGKGSGKKSPGPSSESNSSSEDDSADSQSNSQDSGSSSSDTSEEVERPGRKGPIPRRFRRSASQKNKYTSSGSSSSSSENDSDDSVSNGQGSSSSESSSESENSSSRSDGRRKDGGRGSKTRNSSSERSDNKRSGSNGSRSSEEHNPRPGMNKPPKIPLLPYFVGYQGSSVQNAKDLDPVSAMKKICSQIASELQNPSSIPQKATLSKFSIAARLIRTMDIDQLQKATSQIYAPIKSSEENPWPVFRDAVATAGTGPCLSVVAEWIKTKKISTEEAAEIVATMSYSARTPTAEYLKKYFTLATSPEVTKQPFLNTTAILSFANLARKAQVNNVTAHNFFPVHAFGRLSPINPKAIAEEYIPYMAKQLRSAVKDGDSHKIQVYIRALGNLGHPKILSVFEPYLEGKEPMSTFQRTVMVTSLNKLAKAFPEVARRVLFNVYQNLGEAHEVRCASVIILMRTDPPAFMLQRMAEFTNNDYSLQVTSMVQSAIRSAASLQGPHHHELRKNAQAAVHLLNPKTLGFHYSHLFLKSYVVKEMGLAYKKELSWIGSSDGVIPSSVFLSRRYNIGGWKSQNMVVSAMTASYNDLVDAINNLFEDSDSSSSRSGKHGGKSGDGDRRSSDSDGSHSPLSTEKITEMLNISPEDYDQVEGNFLISYLGARRFFTFDNTTIDNLPSLLKDAANALRSGYRYNYNKLYTSKDVTLAFPTETGLPFVYSLKMPTYISLRGEIEAKTHPDLASGSQNHLRIPETANASASIHFVWSTRMSAKLSFVAPITHQRYVAGLEKSVQINLPIKASFAWDKEKNKVSFSIQPLYPNRDSQIFHYSNTPYTAKHNILDLNPISQGSDFKIVQVREPQTMETTVGKDATGFTFRAKYTSEEKYLDLKTVFEKIDRHDAISLLLYPVAEKNINCNSITLTFDSHRSSSKSATFSYSSGSYTVDSSYSGHDANGSGTDSNESHSPKGKSRLYSVKEPSPTSSSLASPSTSEVISDKRQQEFLRRASSGIRNGSSLIHDYAAEFHGHKKISYVATFAYGYSFSDEISRTLFYFYKSPNEAQSKPFEVCVAAEGTWSRVPLMSFAKALHSDPTTYFSSEISFGEKCGSGASKISIAGKAERSEERKEWLRRDPLGQKCLSQEQAGRYLEPACRNMTTNAIFFNSYSFDIQYERIPSAFKNITYKAYSLARYFGYPYLDENAIDVQNKERKISVDIDLELDLKAFNFSLSTPTMNANFNLVRLHRLLRPLVSLDPSWSTYDRFFNTFLHGHRPPICGVDRDIVSSFDNKTYPIHLGKCWHVVMAPRPKERDFSRTPPATVLVRDYGSHEKEVRIILGDQVYDLKPSGSSKSKHPSESGDADGIVFLNQKQLGMSNQIMNQVTDSNGESLTFWFALPTGEVTFEAVKEHLFILYNGESVWVETPPIYRKDTVGLCGTYDSEPATDFTSPKNCILAEPKMFAASWAVPDQSCQGGAKEMQHRAASAPCYAQTVTPHDVISEGDHKAGYSSSRSYKSRSSSKSSHSSPSDSAKNSGSSSGCTQHRTKVIEQESQVCFSTRLVPVCADNCHATGKLEKSVPMHCVRNASAASHYIDMVKKGANPDFSRKETTKTIKVNVPQGCSPN